MDVVYHSIPATWKNKMIEQGFNYADSTVKEMTDFFETRVDNPDPREHKKKPYASSKKMEGQLGNTLFYTENIGTP